MMLQCTVKRCSNALGWVVPLGLADDYTDERYGGYRDDFDSKKRKQKGGEPWGVKKLRHDPPQYRVYFARYAVNR